MSYFEPSMGNIKAQIGASISAIRQATDAQDIGKVADHVSLLVAIMAPKLKDWRQYRVPDIDPDASDMEDREVFRRCQEILAAVLCELSGQGFYAFSDIEAEDAAEMALEE